MTPAQLETLARQLYNATSDTSFFSQAEIMSYITDACFQIACDSLASEATDTSTTSVADTRAYSIPSDVLMLKRVEYDGNKLEPITFRDDDSLTLSDANTGDTGTPQYYILWNDEILLRPTPDTTGDEIKFYYKSIPAVVTISGTIGVPLEYHYAIANYVVHLMALKDEDPNTADRYMAKWDKELARAKLNERRKRYGDAYLGVHDEEALPTTALGLI